MESLDRILNRDALLALAGERYFERGVGYYQDGRVRSLAELEEYLEIIRLEYKRKLNFMKLLDGME